MVSSYNYVTLKYWGLYSYVPGLLLLLVAVKENLLDILHHKFLKSGSNRISFLCGIRAKNELNYHAIDIS